MYIVINNDIQHFIDTLTILYEYRQIIDFNLLPHHNIEIITCIRTNETTKMISDSPAMSAFIKEIFLKNDKAPFNFGNIQKEISEYNEDPSSNTTKPDNLLAKQHEKRQRISLQHY